RHKDKVGMQILDWMITKEMKNTEYYKMTPSAPRSPNPKMDIAESSAPKRSTVIRFCLPERRSTRLTPPALVPTVDKVDEMILQDTLQVSLAEHKSREEQEARENVELVNKHLAFEKIMEGSENVINDSLPRKNDELNILDTRLELKSDKESSEIEITNDEERREKGKIVEESRNTPFPTPIRSPRIHTELGRYTYLFEHLKTRFLSRKSFDTLADHLQEVMVESLPTMVDTHIKEKVKKQVPEQAKISLQIQKAIDNHIPSQVDASVRSYMSGHILHVHPVQSQTTSVPEQQYQLYLSMKADPQLQQQDIAIWLALQMKFERLQKTSGYEAYVSRESSSSQVNEEERGLSTLGNQEQVDDYDFWTDSYALDDDEIPTQQVSQYIMQEVSPTIDETKLKKMADEMLRQRCTLGDENQYHIDQMKNFLKSDII
ncbi:hypothetical protein Tco_1445115, partial [Tanacetum coccineum]